MSKEITPAPTDMHLTESMSESAAQMVREMVRKAQDTLQHGFLYALQVDPTDDSIRSITQTVSLKGRRNWRGKSTSFHVAFADLDVNGRRVRSILLHGGTKGGFNLSDIHDKGENKFNPFFYKNNRLMSEADIRKLHEEFMKTEVDKEKTQATFERWQRRMAEKNPDLPPVLEVRWVTPTQLPAGSQEAPQIPS